MLALQCSAVTERRRPLSFDDGHLRGGSAISGVTARSRWGGRCFVLLQKESEYLNQCVFSLGEFSTRWSLKILKESYQKSAVICLFGLLKMRHILFSDEYNPPWVKSCFLNSVHTSKVGADMGNYSICCFIVSVVCACVSVVVEAEADVLEEDVFQEEAESCLFSPLHSETIDFPDTPVSLHAFALQMRKEKWCLTQLSVIYLVCWHCGWL